MSEIGIKFFSFFVSIVFSFISHSLDSMAIDEAKRIFQGGLQFIPVKHGNAKRVEYNSGIYVTCNEVRIRNSPLFVSVDFFSPKTINHLQRKADF